VIVLGPDCASTGGYPVIGVLDDAACARLGRTVPGDRVRFVEG
jgi:allophanate hydrolase subunit 2